MKKAINLYSFNMDTLKKISLIKDAGFDAIYTGIYNKNENISLDNVISEFKKYNFIIPQMHCSYIEPELKNFWYNNESGDIQEESLKQQIKQTGNYGIKNFIKHTNGEFNSPKTQIGINRIKRLLKVAEENDVNLCIENLYDFEQMKYIFDNIDHKYLKVCYDCGHHNCLNNESDVFNVFKNKITVLHLHDNFGKLATKHADIHKILGEGSLNLDKLAYYISQLPNDVVLCAEYKADKGEEICYFLYRAKASLDKLDLMINKYKIMFNED